MNLVHSAVISLSLLVLKAGARRVDGCRWYALPKLNNRCTITIAPAPTLPPPPTQAAGVPIVHADWSSRRSRSWVITPSADICVVSQVGESAAIGFRAETFPGLTYMISLSTEPVLIAYLEKDEYRHSYRIVGVWYHHNVKAMWGHKHLHNMRTYSKRELTCRSNHLKAIPQMCFH